MVKNKKGVRLKLSLLTFWIFSLGGTVALGSIGVMALTHKKPEVQTVDLEKDEAPLANPFKGFLTQTDTVYEETTLPQTLVYASLTWRMIEPKPGKIDFKAFEKYWDAHSRLGRRFGFRVKCADPWSNSEVDIPDWLAKKVKMRPYEIDGGKGLAPDWDSPHLLKAHKRLIQQLGKRYNKDPRLAWVDVGTYGIWGEWHVYKNQHLKAKKSSKKAILEVYIKSFPDKPLIMAFDDDYALKMLIDQGGGVRNDCLGKSDQNKWFIDSLKRVSPDFFNQQALSGAWVGGEFCGSEEGALEGIRDRLEINLEHVRNCRWSFIGPAGGDLLVSSGEDLKRASKMHKALGYRFLIHDLKLPSYASKRYPLKFSFEINNVGSAPFPFDWPMELRLKSKKGKRVKTFPLSKKSFNPRLFKPGATSLKVKWSSLDMKKVLKGMYQLQIAIIDPQTEKPGVKFAHLGHDEEGYLTLGELQIK